MTALTTRPLLLLGVALLAALADAGPVPAFADAKPTLRAEGARPGPPRASLRHLPPQMPPGMTTPTRASVASTNAATAAGFLTLPFVGYPAITSIFDHCNPDYTVDGKVCRFDGAVGLKSNGVDPNFTLGYAMTPGGTDYLYYDGHNGFDYGIYYQNVLAAADGSVRLAGSDSINPCFGQTIIVDHPNGFSTRYAHLSTIYVKVGDAVTRGQVIAVSGNTGCSTGPHLHFGVYVTSGWTAIDPYGWTGSTPDPWPSDSGDLWLGGNPAFPPPGAPTNVTATAGDGAATVSWTAPTNNAGNPIGSYTVTAAPGGASTTVAGSRTSATLSLANYTTYTFTVTASNGFAVSAPSSPSNAVTPRPPWAASYDLSAVPAHWAVNQAQTFSVKLTNIGSQAWPSAGSTAVALGIHFTNGPGGYANNANWTQSQLVPISADVPSLGSATVSVTLTAPDSTAAPVVEAVMVKLQQFWFHEFADLRTTLTPEMWASSYGLGGVSRSWQPGQTQSVTVSVTNTGNQAWPAGGNNPVNLDLHFASAAGGYPNNGTWLSSQLVPLAADLAPGQSTTLTAAVTAPTGGSPLVLEAEMVRLGAFWFRDWGTVAVNVGPAVWAASYDLSQVPRSWTAGQSQTFSMTVTNTGNQAWPATGSSPVQLNLHFATGSGGYPNSAAWLSSQFFVLPAAVLPGQSATVSVTASAPAGGGPTVLEAEMVQTGQFWFLQWGPAAVTNAQPIWASSYGLGGVPRSWQPGQTQSVTVTVTNSGNQAWPAGGSNPVNLNLHFATAAGGYPNNGAWLNSQLVPLASDVAPGQSANVTVGATAPSGGSPLVLEAEMVRLGAFWFPDWGSVAVNVGPAVWAASYDLSNVPRSWTAGQSQTFSITVTNTGNQAWPATGSSPVQLNLHFATGSGGYPNSAAWLSSQFFVLPAAVLPGQSATVSVTASAPAGGSPTVLEAEMVETGQFWFLQWGPKALIL